VPSLERHPRRVMRFSFYASMACLVVSLGLSVVGMAHQVDIPVALPVSTLIGIVSLVGIFLLSRLRGQVVGLFVEAQRSENARETLMTEDEITGALTRRVFLSACADEMRRVGKSRVYALFAVDMDYLKALNDSLGHTAGDFALRHLVKILRRSFPTAIVGRLGGDEFCVFAPVDDATVAEDQCRAFFEALHRPTAFDGRMLNLSASIGFALTPTHSEFFGELMQCADLALYESKRKGRGQATLFHDEMLNDRRHQRFIERELRAAILLDELSLVYQPITGADGCVRGYESLLRWNHPVRGPIPPGDFIPVAEQIDDLRTLGEWVFRRALTDARDFGELSIAVNISPCQLKRDDVVHMVARVLEETAVEPGRVTLELTETMAMNANPDILRRFAGLRAMGLKISLDDFGTGYCGFAHLRSFPVDTIKIDRSYIARLGESHADDVLVTALASVATAMQLDIVAEGIETEEQLRLAKIAGCSFFQGYHIARPMTKAALMQGLAESRQAA
jgi:diguanylate cyclase (GGDEF)-like protein